MDVTSKGLGSVVGGTIFMQNSDHNILLIAVAVTAMLVGTAVVVSSLFRVIAQRAYKNR